MRRVKLWLFQRWCFISNKGKHPWNERELDLGFAVPGYRNPCVWFCGKCGASVIREDDE